MRDRAYWWALVAAVAVATAGCGRGDTDRCGISGTVTLAGQTVDGGNIEFSPMTANQASASGAMIQAGRYSVPRTSGLVPGKYRVRIYCAEKINAEIVPTITGGPQKTNAAPSKELIPAKYNAESQLTIEVRQGGGNTFDFALEQ